MPTSVPSAGSSAQALIMATVYILKSVIGGHHYIGCTEDLQRRFREHNDGTVKSTCRYKPWFVVLKQEYPSLSEARMVESRLKKLKRKDYIEKIITDGCIKMGLGNK